MTAVTADSNPACTAVLVELPPPHPPLRPVPLVLLFSATTSLPHHSACLSPRPPLNHSPPILCGSILPRLLCFPLTPSPLLSSPPLLHLISLRFSSPHLPTPQVHPFSPASTCPANISHFSRIITFPHPSRSLPPPLPPPHPPVQAAPSRTPASPHLPTSPYHPTDLTQLSSQPGRTV